MDITCSGFEIVTVATDWLPPMPTVGYLMALPGREETPEGTGGRGMVMAGFTCLFEQDVNET